MCIPDADNLVLTGGTIATDGVEYVAYLFAEDESELIKCGTFTDPGNNQPITVECGFAPQWLLVKAATVAGGWKILDTTRGWSQIEEKTLNADTATAEVDDGPWHPTETGFYVDTGYYTIPVASGGSPVDVIYVAIAAPVVTSMTQAQVNEMKLLSTTRAYRAEKYKKDLTARAAELRAALEAQGYTTAQINTMLN